MALKNGCKVSSFYPVVIIIRLFVEKWPNICFFKGHNKITTKTLVPDLEVLFRYHMYKTETDGQPENRIKNF